jgi:hypothetical protein
MRLACYLASAVPLALMVSPIHAGPILLVVPSGQASAVANDNSGSLAGSIPNLEAQDVFGASQFSSFGGSLLITQLAFRLKPGTGSINAMAASFAIYLSTTTFAPNGNNLLTTTLATNRGPDYTQVVSGPGALWSSPGCAGPGPCPFDIVYTFGTPFLYNPSKGNLLAELQFSGYNGVGSGHRGEPEAGQKSARLDDLFGF